MDRKSNRIGFGGGCHWCTEAVFQSLNEVQKVEQGYHFLHRKQYCLFRSRNNIL